MESRPLVPVATTGCILEAHRSRTSDMNATTMDPPVRYQVTGMDCPSCATKIEGAARSVPGIEEVRVSIASQEMTLWLREKTAPLPELEQAITGLGYRLTLL